MNDQMWIAEYRDLAGVWHELGRASTRKEGCAICDIHIAAGTQGNFNVRELA